MRHRVGSRKLNRTTSHRLAMLGNMVASLIEHEAIRTTLPKAKEARRVVERVITLGKRGGLANVRLAARTLHDKGLLQKVFGNLRDRYAERPGGYTRIVRLGYRSGDAAQMALLELVDRPETEKEKPDQKKATESKKASGGGETGTSNRDQETKRQEPPAPAPAPTPPRTTPRPADERREAKKRPVVVATSAGSTAPSAGALSAVFFQCAGAREVCGALRTAVDEALDKAGLRSVRNAAKADIAVDARVTALGANATQSFDTTLSVQSYAIDVTAETTGTAEAVSMPPSTTVSYDPRFGSERVVEKARLVAGDVVDKVQAFAQKRGR